MRRLAGTLAFIVSTALVSAILIEIGVRLLMPQHLTYDVYPELYQPDDDIGWRRSADTRLVSQRDGLDVAFCTDSRGDRVSCEGFAGANGSRERVGCRGHLLVVGDSFVEALFVPYEETVWAQVERATGMCTHVAGVGGWGLGQYVRIVRERLAVGDPPLDGIVLNIYTGNDFAKDPWEIPGAETVTRPPFTLLPGGLTWYEIRSWLHPYAQVLESNSHAWMAIRNRLLWYEWRRWLHPSLRLSWFSEERADANLEPIRAIVDEAGAQGVPVLVTLIPIMKQVLDPSGDELVAYMPQVAGDADMDLPSKRMSARITSIPGVRYVDLLPGLRQRVGPDHFLPNDSHFNGRGHAVWFELVRTDLDELLGASGN